MSHLAALLCLIVLALAAPAHAQTQIHRCIGGNGGAVFTDQPCAALQATPVRPSASAPARISPSTPLPTLCAGSIDALRQSVIDAFAARNPNRMAGLMLWDGYGRESVIAAIRSLNELMKRPLVDVDITGRADPTRQDATSPDAGGMGADPFASSAVAAPPAPAAARDQLVLHTAGVEASGNAEGRRFSVVRRAGCLWLRSP